MDGSLIIQWPDFGGTMDEIFELTKALWGVFVALCQSLTQLLFDLAKSFFGDIDFLNDLSETIPDYPNAVAVFFLFCLYAVMPRRETKTTVVREIISEPKPVQSASKPAPVQSVPASPKPVSSEPVVVDPPTGLFRNRCYGCIRYADALIGKRAPTSGRDTVKCFGWENRVENGCHKFHPDNTASCRGGLYHCANLDMYAHDSPNTGGAFGYCRAHNQKLNIEKEECPDFVALDK